MNLLALFVLLAISWWYWKFLHVNKQNKARAYAVIIKRFIFSIRLYYIKVFLRNAAVAIYQRKSHDHQVSRIF